MTSPACRDPRGGSTGGGGWCVRHPLVIDGESSQGCVRASPLRAGGRGGGQQDWHSVQMTQAKWLLLLCGGSSSQPVFLFPAVTGSSTHACLGEKTWTKAGSLGCWAWGWV